MNLSTLLEERAADGHPVRIGLIGAGKFGSMVLAQARHIDRRSGCGKGQGIARAGAMG